MPLQPQDCSQEVGVETAGELGLASLSLGVKGKALGSVRDPVPR